MKMSSQCGNLGHSTLGQAHDLAKRHPKFNGSVAICIGNEFHSYGILSIFTMPEGAVSRYRAAKRSKKSGKVFDTQEGFSTMMPAVRRPTTAKLIAIRWSS